MHAAFDVAKAWATVWLVAAAAVGQWIPISQQTGTPGISHVAFGATAVWVAALCALLITRAHLGVLSAVIAAALTVSAVALVVDYTNLAPSAVAAGVVVAGLIALSAVSKVTLWLARLPVPALPAAGQDTEVASEFTDTDMAVLETRSLRAVELSSGLRVYAAALVATAAAWTVDPKSYYLPIQIAIALCTALILLLRGRTMPERIQAYAMFAAAGSILFASAGKLILTSPTGWQQLAVVTGVAMMLAVFVIVAVVVAPRTLAPTMRRWVERLEMLAIVATIPLCVWVTGMFAALRGLTFGGG